MKRKLREGLKSLAIAALAANAVFLAYKSEIFNEFLYDTKLNKWLGTSWVSGEPGSSSSSSDSESYSSGVIAKPVSMAVMGDVGARCGAKYDEMQLAEMYEKTVNIVGEALGSAALPEKCSEREWKRALASTGVYWDYQVELPIAFLVKWFGMSAVNENPDSASRLAAVISDELVCVYYANADGYYKCATAATKDGLLSVVQEFLPNGAYFAFESDDLRRSVEEYTLLLPEISEKYVLDVDNIIAGKDIQEHTAEILGMNILGGASYLEKNGTMVFVGVGGILRIHPDGEVNYSATDQDYFAAGDNVLKDEQIVERAYGLISDIRAGHTGVEELYLSDIKTNKDGNLEVSFNYFVDGTIVIPRRGNAATAVYKNGKLLTLDIWMHSYSVGTEKAELLPELQASAIAGGIEKDGTLRLVYYDGSSGSASPSWTVKKQ